MNSKIQFLIIPPGKYRIRHWDGDIGTFNDNVATTYVTPFTLEFQKWERFSGMLYYLNGKLDTFTLFETSGQ